MNEFWMYVIFIVVGGFGGFSMILYVWYINKPITEEDFIRRIKMGRKKKKQPTETEQPAEKPSDNKNQTIEVQAPYNQFDWYFSTTSSYFPQEHNQELGKTESRTKLHSSTQCDTSFEESPQKK